MALKLEHHNRQVFKKSFLKNVQCVLAVDSFEWTDDIHSKINNFLKTRYFKIEDTGTVPMVQAKKDSLVLNFTQKGLVISIDKKHYKSFDDFILQLTDLCDLLNLVNKDKIMSLVFQKQNAFIIYNDSQKNKLNKQNVLRFLFTDQVLNNTTPGLLIDNCFYTVKYQYKDEEQKAVVELLVSAMYLKEFQLNQLEKILSEINCTMYDYWYESVTDNVRIIMNK